MNWYICYKILKNSCSATKSNGFGLEQMENAYYSQKLLVISGLLALIIKIKKKKRKKKDAIYLAGFVYILFRDVDDWIATKSLTSLDMYIWACIFYLLIFTQNKISKLLVNKILRWWKEIQNDFSYRCCRKNDCTNGALLFMRRRHYVCKISSNWRKSPADSFPTYNYLFILH